MEINGYGQSLVQATAGRLAPKKAVIDDLPSRFKQMMAPQNPPQLTVKAGDTVSELALQYHTSIDAIVQSNHLQDPNLILIGQKLMLANSSQAEAIATPTRTNAVTNDESIGKAGVQQQAVQFAKQFLGNAYVWGSAKPGAFDCSGLVSYAYQQFGVQLPHLAQAQADQTRHIATKHAQAGDLLFWQNQRGHVYHVAIALGDGHYVNALDPAHGVQIDGMAAPANFAGRVIR
ncbi:C40 family peptidase [Periweissella ghanensis]|uniref:Peptidoglycan endopeptidase n=1 Tax=Periweissella ghanensis TaxID=467997 RepID=A0ABM8Z8Q5_9LACO|nr:C40 family peptidase [Periweissella ghanensis]MCM0601088.1 C40 family peptidase [Periweissella ghanensis]CAH0417829.1 hypothetical protein WGH24286_00244 [Periweissella ghanensis]